MCLRLTTFLVELGSAGNVFATCRDNCFTVRNFLRTSRVHDVIPAPILTLF